MAGHKMSGYISTFWHVLFAPFIQLFTRIFPFAKAKNPPPSQHQRHNQQQPSISYNPDSLAPDTDPAFLHQRQQHLHQHNHSRNHSHSHQYQHPDSPTHSGQDQDQDSDSPPHDHLMAATKKRGGQKRGGVKANGPKPTAAAATKPAAADQSNNKPASQTKPNATSNTSAPAGVTPLANQRDTRHQPDGPKPTASRRGSRGGRNRGRSSPTSDNTNGKKENGTPLNDSGPGLAQNAQSTTLKPLAAADNKADPQKPGTRSQDATKPVISTATTNDENVAAQDAQVEHVRTVVDRLTLDEAPTSEQAPERDLIKATAAAETSALPVPVVVAIPLPAKSVPPKLTVPETPPTPVLPGLIEPKTEEERVEREYHLKYMREALDMGNLALNTNETPVGCVLVYHGRTIAKGMNATNVTRNGTRHAEFMALSALLSQREQGDVGDVNASPALDDASWGDVNPRDGHIYPYGQKLHPAPVVDRAIISECVLYVTVEPCVMCASLLRQLGIKKVYFGAVNDKFGGTGGVFRIHMNSKPVPKPTGRPYQNGYGPQDVDRISKGRVSSVPRDEDDGDGGNVEPGFPAEGGYLRDDAVSLLRRFYVQENGRAPQPRKKEGRAARLFAMENQAKTGSANGSTSEFSDTATLPDTPVDAEPPTEDREMLESLH
ncbi:cytidine deaminase-like protein [Biscogniauxia marginata]|nr:cytidine deaminase-like protein [Biscogniauxia marginata]